MYDSVTSIKPYKAGVASLLFKLSNNNFLKDKFIFSSVVFKYFIYIRIHIHIYVYKLNDKFLFSSVVY